MTFVTEIDDDGVTRQRQVRDDDRPEFVVGRISELSPVTVRLRRRRVRPQAAPVGFVPKREAWVLLVRVGERWAVVQQLEGL